MNNSNRGPIFLGIVTFFIVAPILAYSLSVNLSKQQNFCNVITDKEKKYNVESYSWRFDGSISYYKKSFETLLSLQGTGEKSVFVNGYFFSDNKCIIKSKNGQYYDILMDKGRFYGESVYEFLQGDYDSRENAISELNNLDYENKIDYIKNK